MKDVSAAGHRGGSVARAGAALCFALWSMTWFTTSPCRAQDATTTATARSLFEEGTAAADAGDHATAADRLERSLALRRSPVVAFNLAQSLLALGRLVAGSELLVAVEREATQEALREAARALREPLGARFARLRVRVGHVPPGVELRLDAATVPDALLGTSMAVDPGNHVVSAVGPAGELARSEIVLSEGQVSDVELAIPADVDARASDSVAGTDGVGGDGGDDTLVVVVATVLAVAAVGIGLGVGLGVGLSGSGEPPVAGNLSPSVLRFGP